MVTALIAIVSTLAAFAFAVLIALDWGQRYGRKLLRRAAGYYEKRQFDYAREAVIAAVRMKPELKEHAEIKAFYELLISRPREVSPAVAHRIVELAAEFPPNRVEQFMARPEVQVAVVCFILVIVMARLAGIS